MRLEEIAARQFSHAPELKTLPLYQWQGFRARRKYDKFNGLLLSAKQSRCHTLLLVQIAAPENTPAPASNHPNQVNHEFRPERN